MAKTKKKTKSHSSKNSSRPTPIPQDFPAISAHLVVGDVKKALDFYHKAFGFDLMGEPMTMGKAIIGKN